MSMEKENPWNNYQLKKTAETEVADHLGRSDKGSVDK